MKKNRLGSLIKEFSIPGLITLITLLVVFLLKGIWPLGQNRIDFFDNMQQVAPLYAHLWDFMHGKASIWFDWYTGYGTNVSMSISAFSMLSPFNILLYFCPRDYILEFISILTLVKLTFASIAMYGYLYVSFKNLDRKVKVALAVLYSFGGYVIVYASCFTPWMDIVAIFPLLMMAYDRLFYTGKKLFYTIMVAIMFIINYYLGAMSLIYILLVGGIRMFAAKDKETWKKKTLNTGLGTAGGLALSCFVLIPVFMQLSTSQRGGSSESLISQYLGWIVKPVATDISLGIIERSIMLFGLSFCFVLVIAAMIREKKNSKSFKESLGMLILVLAPVVSEGVNLMWHFGSYNGYTLRNGFIIAFTMIVLTAKYVEIHMSENSLVTTKKPLLNDDKLSNKEKIISIFLIAFVCCAFAILYNKAGSLGEVAGFIFVNAVFVIFLAIYIFMLIKSKKGLNIRRVLSFMIVEIFLGVYAFTGPPKFYSYAAYQYGDYVQLAVGADNSLEIEESATDRIVNPDISLNANYPLILRRGATSSFTAALLENTQDYSRNFGYSKYFLWLLDSGGTVFTNALFHVTEAVNQLDLDNYLYTLERQEGDFKLYSCNYTLPFAMSINKSILDKGLKEYGDATDWSRGAHGDWIDLHNIFYSAMVGDSEAYLVNRYEEEANITKTDTVLSASYSYYIGGTQALYISLDTNNDDNDANSSMLYEDLTVYVNGKAVNASTLGDLENVSTPDNYNNGLLYLGTYADEDVEIVVECKDIDNYNRLITTVGGVDLGKLGELCDSYNNNTEYEVSYDNSSLTLTYNNYSTESESDDSDGSVSSDCYIIMPVIYNSDNWSVTISGKSVEADNVFGLFTGVNLEEGNNTITLEFKAKGTTPGLLITIISLIIIIAGSLYAYLTKKGKLKNVAIFGKCEKLLSNLAVWVYGAIFVLMTIFMFAIPIVTSVFANVIQIFKGLMSL